MKAIISFGCLILLFSSAFALQYQAKRVLIRVYDGRKRPVKGVYLRLKPNGVISQATDQNGLTWIDVPFGTTPGKLISIQIVNQRGQNWVTVGSDDQIIVPSFDVGTSDNIAKVTVVRRGDAEILGNGEILFASASRILRRLSPSELEKNLSPQQRRSVLDAEAKRLGVAPKDLDKAIRAWAERVNDPYQKAIAALYEQRFKDALPLLELSYKQAHAKIFEVSVNYAFAQYNLGYYLEAARLYQEALNERPEDYHVMNELGLMRLYLAQYDEAERLFNSSLTIMKGVLQPDDQNIAFTLMNMGLLLRLQGDFDLARQTYNNAFVILNSKFNLRSAEIASIYNAYGALDLAEGKTDDAYNNFNKTLLVYEKLPKRQYEYANVLINLSAAQLENGELENAASGFEKALRSLNQLVKNRIINQDHPIFARWHNEYAGVFDRRQKFTEAEEHFNQAKAILQKLYLDKHPLFASVLNNLAVMYAHSNKHKLVKALLDQALFIRQSALGEAHPDVARTQISLGAFFTQQGDFAEAESRFNIALNILKDKPAYNPDLANLYNNWGGLSLKMGKPEKTEEYFKMALELRKKFKTQRPIDYTQSLINLADFYTRSQRFKDAEPLFEEALQIREKIPKIAPQAIAEVLLPYGLLYARQGKKDQTLGYWKRALELTDITPETALLARSLNNLGELYRQMGRLNDSEPLLRRAYEMWPRLGYGGSDDLVITCIHYKDLLNQLGRDVPNEIISCAEHKWQKAN